MISGIFPALTGALMAPSRSSPSSSSCRAAALASAASANQSHKRYGPIPVSVAEKGPGERASMRNRRDRLGVVLLVLPKNDPRRVAAIGRGERSAKAPARHPTTLDTVVHSPACRGPDRTPIGWFASRAAPPYRPPSRDPPRTKCVVSRQGGAVVGFSIADRPRTRISRHESLSQARSP